MIKYDGYYITFQEIPNEVSLTFAVTNCPHNCEGCHSPWLRDNIGKDLCNDIDSIIEKYDGLITCVCFMGEGNDTEGLADLTNLIKYKTAIYVGLDKVEPWMYSFDYIKIGRYDSTLGGLNSSQTNQRFYKNNSGKLEDITHLFNKKEYDF